MGEHESFIRQSIALAESAARRGDEPFGAMLVGAAGELLLAAANEVASTGDRTRHAELILVSRAMRDLADDAITTATMYASTEPCAMCAGALYWAGISRVVFGCSQARLGRLTGGSLSLPCRTILSAGRRRVEVIGPVLEDEAFGVHRRYWGAPR